MIFNITLRTVMVGGVFLKRRDFLLKLHLCAGIGNKTATTLYQTLIQSDFHGDIVDLCQHSGLSVTKTQQIVSNWYSQTLDEQVARHQAQCEYVTILDDDYPIQLRETYCPPLILFFCGDRQLLKTRMLGVVGARRHTSYGGQSLRLLLPAVLASQITVVSGLARGIDALGHTTAIQHRGRTIGVIGTGLDCYYPREHRSLQAHMMQHELVVTEYPLGSRPYPSHFPERNRIIAGLCETLLVVEAQEKSGSLITASLALQENRNVCAIPGRIDAPMSVGCNQLIAAGAKPILTSEDLLSEFRNSGII